MSTRVDADITHHLSRLEEERSERGSVYEDYGSAGQGLINPIYDLAILARHDYPDAVLRLLREFL